MTVKGFQDTIDWYDANADVYMANADKGIPQQAIDTFVKLLKPGAKVLEAGCAGGRDTEIFFKKGIDITGVDASEGLLSHASKSNPAIPYIKADFRGLPFPDSEFDAIWCHAALVHMETIEDLKKSLEEFHRVLKTGGLLYIYVKKQQGEEKTAIVHEPLIRHDRFFRFYTPEEFEQYLIETNFKIKSLRICDDALGRRDTKWIEVLARK